MSLKIAYILGAGLGTRMGAIGKELPKLLWPVFEKSLLELQVDYAISCGVEKIYLNTHFQSDQIVAFANDKNIKIEILKEDTLLDIGGAIHSLAEKLNYKGKVLILNGDQFLMLSKNMFEGFYSNSDEYVATLLGLKVPRNSQYNELIVTSNILKSIEKPSSTDEYYTYSGVSIINFDMLKVHRGKSKFFETIADYKENKVFVYKPKSCEYWDFGTTERYIESMRRVLVNGDSTFRKFLVANNGFMNERVQSGFCYNAQGKEYSINLNNAFLSEGHGNIVISGNDQNAGEGSIVIYKDIVSRA